MPSSLPKVLLLETIATEAMEHLKLHTEPILAPAPDQGLTVDNLDQFVALISRGKGKVDTALLQAMPQLKVVARPGVGLDNVAVDTATEQGVMVINSPGINHHTVAEHALSLMLMLMRNLVPTVLEVKKDNWGVRNGLQTDEIRGKTLGLLGMGNIGQRLAEMATVMGMHVQYWDLRSLDLPYPARKMEEILSSSDIVSLHLPLTPETKHLLDSKALALLSPKALLINTARGALIDQPALVNALENGKIGGFGADVLDPEPPEMGESLLRFPNVLITPHSASLTATTYLEMCETAVQNVLTILQGQPIPARFWANRPTK